MGSNMVRMSKNPDISARGNHTGGNPPTGSPVAWVRNVQTQNSFEPTVLPKTGAENQGPSGSKLLVEDKPPSEVMSSQGSITISMENLLLEEKEVGADKLRTAQEMQINPANPVAGLNESGMADFDSSTPKFLSMTKGRLVNPSANWESTSLPLAMTSASGLKVAVGKSLEIREAQETPVNPGIACGETTATSLPTPLLPSIGSMVNPNESLESTSEPMDADTVPGSGMGLSKRQMKRIRQKLSKAAKKARTKALAGSVTKEETSVEPSGTVQAKTAVCAFTTDLALSRPSSTPVAETGKRKRSDDHSSELIDLTVEASVFAPAGKKKAKRRKANKPDSRVANSGKSKKAATGQEVTSRCPAGSNGGLTPTKGPVGTYAGAAKNVAAVVAGKGTLSGRSSITNDRPKAVTGASGTSTAVAKNATMSKALVPKPGTQPSVATGSYAQVAASLLTVEICVDGGQSLLSKKQIDFVDSQVWDAIGTSKEVPNFERMRTKQGTIQVQCSNSRSLEWLTSTVEKMPVFEGCKFVTRQIGKTQRLTRVSMMIPGQPREPRALITRLRSQNVGLDTTHWKIYQYTKAGTDPKLGNASRLVFGVDSESLKVIRSKYGMRLYLNLGRVLVTTLNSDKGMAKQVTA